MKNPTNALFPPIYDVNLSFVLLFRMKSKPNGRRYKWNSYFVLIYLFLNTCGIQGVKSSLSEVDLSAPPLLVCECALAAENDECKENFEDWLIIREGFMQHFTKFGIYDVSEDDVRYCYEEYEWRYWPYKNQDICSLLMLKKVVLLGTGHRSQLHNLVDDKDNLILCPNSIPPNLTSIIIKGVKEIHVSPETIMERETSLRFELRNIEGNLIFPIGLYDYNYKITEEGTDRITGKKIHEEPVVIILYLFEVHDVKIESNCISTEGVKLSVTHATSLTIESSAVFDLLPEHSGISLKEIDKVDIYSTFSNYLIIDSCKLVTLHTKSISESIHHLMLSNINYFETKEYSYTPTNLSLFSISNITKWIPFSNSIVSQFSKQFHEDNENKTFQSHLMIKNTTVFAKSQKDSVLLLMCDKLTIETTQFAQLSIEPELFLKFWTELGNYKDINSGSDSFSTTENGEIEVGVSGENDSTLIFITSSFFTDVIIPNWVYICLLNDSITCPIESTSHKCPLGFPHNFEAEDYKQKGCYETRATIDMWTLFYKFSLTFGGGFAVIITLLLVFALFRWQNKKHATWKPSQVNMPYLKSSPSKLEGVSQLVHVPPRDSQIAFTFPKRFYGKTTTSKCVTLEAVNLSFAAENHIRTVDDHRNEEKMSPSIELVRIKFLDDSEESEPIWMNRRRY